MLAKSNTPFADTKPGSGKCSGSFTCIFCKEIFEGDKRRICCDKPECQEKLLERKKEREKRLKKRRKKNTYNPCQICGKDKGANRFYCKTCHTKLSNQYVSENDAATIRIESET